jgi:signal transduction histidine kinase
VVGRALSEARPVLVEDMLAEPNRARPDLDARSGIRSYLAVPLAWRGETLGLVTVGVARPGALQPSHTELVSELAEQAAAAVAHAHTYAAERAQREQLAALNRALAQAQQQLVQNEKLTAIGQLAHGIAHELNTPLGVILSNLSVLTDYGETLARAIAGARLAVQQLRAGDASEIVASQLDATLSAADLDYLLDDLPTLTDESAAAANRIAAIVRSVALFARGGSNRQAPVRLEEALEAAITLAWNELKQRAEVVRAFASTPPVSGDASELTQLFVHLLLNAAQALEDGRGVVTVSTAHEDDCVVIRIADTGRGIPAESLPRIFEPFFTTRPVGEGSGLGLAVCHGVVTRHGGTIDVQSSAGAGTTVTVRLPRLVSPAEAGSAAA